MAVNNVPDAELLIAPGCVHCPVVLSGLAELVKKGVIGHLEVFNIAARPDAATLGHRKRRSPEALFASARVSASPNYQPRWASPCRIG